MNELTREKILSMNEGAELDILVASKVMGWKQCSLEGVRNFTAWGKPKDFEDSDPRVKIPNYSTDIAASWEVVEKMHELNWWIVINYQEEEKNVFFYWDPHQTGYDVSAETIPLAICRASLLAVMEL